MNVLGMALFPIILVVFYVAMLALGVLVLRAIVAGGVREGIRAARRDEDPLTILEQRYARGEIDETEYERRRAVLRSEDQGRRPPAR